MILSTLEDGRIQRTSAEGLVFDTTCDVLCVGAGSAGVYAADAAAREGASVILCELSSNLGGMHVTGCVTGYYFGSRGGAHEAEHKKCKEDTLFFSRGQWEEKQIHLTERLAESGVRVLTRTSATGVYFEGDRAVGLRVFDGARSYTIGAGMIIDATSDGHLLRMTDVKKHYGRPNDGSFAPFTVRTQYIKEGRFASSNADSGHMNHYDAVDFSRNTILAHAAAERLLAEGDFLHHALQVGIREGLTFEGEDAVRYADVLLRRVPERILFYAYADFDRHGSEHATDEALFQSFWVVANLATVTFNIPVPMGSIVPKGLRGLVTAGRCLSTDSYAQSAVRMNRDMFRMGECVGVAAAMAVTDGDILAIDYREYRRRVEARGCFNGFGDRVFGFDNTYGHYLNKMRALGRTPDPRYEGMRPLDKIYEPIDFDVNKTFHLLATDAPGVALWSCFLAEDRAAVRERLFVAMTEADGDLARYNCALGLGLLEDARALPVLREIVDRRDCFFFTDNRRSNQFRSAAAVCLLGRLGTVEDLPRLYGILSEEELARAMYHTLEANYLYHTEPDRNFVYFAMMTHAVMAIIGIAGREGLALDALGAILADDSLLRRVTSEPPGRPAHEETAAFLRYARRLIAGE